MPIKDNTASWLGSVEFTNLLSDHVYEVEYESRLVKFRTFPDKRTPTRELSLTFGSCSSLTGFPWNSLHSAFAKILALAPNFSLFLGDNIYTDIHEALPWYRIKFDTAYSRLLAQPAVQEVLRTIPTFTMFDDHEVENDFRGLRHPFAKEGIDAYIKFMGQRNPGRSTNISNLYYSFSYGDLATVFVLEMRLNYDPDNGKAFGTQQKQSLIAWLRTSTEERYRYIIIASPLSWSKDGHGDTFDKDRAEIFQLIESLDLCNVIILSGDMHFGAVYKHVHGRVMEFSASPFQALPFWPELDPRDDAASGYGRIFIHGGLKLYFGRLTLRRDDGLFELYRWPLLHPQHEPQLFDSFAFSRCELFNSTR